MTDPIAHPLIVELFRLLPAPGTTWPLDSRDRWFDAMGSVLDLLFPDVEPVARRVAVADVFRKAPSEPAASEPKGDEAPPKGDEPPPAGPAKPKGKPESARVEDHAPRPDGIPTSFLMTAQVLKDAPAGLTMREVSDEIAKRWWPGLQVKYLTPEFYRYIGLGRIVRDGEGKMTLTDAGRAMLAKPPKAEPPPKPDRTPPGASKIEAKAAAAQVDPPGKLDLTKPPADMPGVHAMVKSIIEDTGPRTVTGLVVSITDRWWKGMTFEILWPQLKPMIDGGKFRRTADGKIHMPVEATRATAERFAEHRRQQAAPAAPKPPRQVVNQGAKLGPPSKADVREFEWKGQSVKLPVKEWRALQRLKPVIGKGFLAFTDITSSVFAGDRPCTDPTGWLRGAEPLINSKIERLGLRFELVPKMGYALKELS